MNEWWWLSALLISLACLASLLFAAPFQRRFVVSLFLTPVILAMSFLGYYFWGGFTQWQEYVRHQNSLKQANAMLQSIKTPQELINKLRAKLDDNPNSAKGWYLLGRLYVSQSESKKAVEAFVRAVQLSPNNEQYTVNYAHSLWQFNNRQFSKQIVTLFNDLLRKNPHQPDALSMLAMNAFTQHQYGEAIKYWQKLLLLVPPQSEEAQAIRKAIVTAEGQLKLP